jgi:hypothetical protein
LLHCDAEAYWQLEKDQAQLGEIRSSTIYS